MKLEILLVALLVTVLVAGSLAKSSGKRRGRQRQQIQFDRSSRTGTTTHTKSSRTGTTTKSSRTGTTTKSSRTGTTTRTESDGDDGLSLLFAVGMVVGPVINSVAGDFQFCLNDCGIITFQFENPTCFFPCFFERLANLQISDV